MPRIAPLCPADTAELLAQPCSGTGTTVTTRSLCHGHSGHTAAGPLSPLFFSSFVVLQQLHQLLTWDGDPRRGVSTLGGQACGTFWGS